MADPAPFDPPPEGFRQRRFRPPAGATQVLLVRHGASAPAHPDRPFPLRDGHGDPPLSDVGHRQAECLAGRLMAVHASDPFDAVYVTTLQRTSQTAAPFLRLAVMEAGVEADLREVHLGEWEGGRLRIHAAAGHPLVDEWRRTGRWDVIPGAEPQEDFARRVARGFRRAVDRHRGGRVVLVVHGGVIGQLLADLTGAHAAAFSSADNASISELVVIGEDSILRRFNDAAHLDGVAD